MEVSASTWIDAQPAEVWDLVADVTRIGEFSPETFEARWIDGATGPAPGARFRGHVKRNERGPVYWSVCRVTDVEEARSFGFDVLGPDGSALTHWRYELAPEDGGTRLTESMHLQRSWYLDVYDATFGRLRRRYNERNIATTLGRIKAVVEGTEPPARTARGPRRPMVVSDEVVVPAPPAAVWPLVADPTALATWSPENQGADTPRTGPLQVGDRFVGHNRRGAVRWSTSCVVTAADEPHRFAFTVDEWGGPNHRAPVDIASWSYELEEVEGGTRVVQSWHDDRDWPDAAATVFDLVATRERGFHVFQAGNIRRSLDRLARLVAEREGA